MKNLVRSLAVIAVGIILFSCGNKNQNNDADIADVIDPREDQTMQRSGVDTAGVLYLVNDYLRKLQENKIDSAMEMLYEADGDTVVPISDKNKAEIIENLKVFPVLKYTINNLLMYSEQDTEVRYTIEYFKKTPDNPMSNTLQCVINPRRVGYYWYLTIPKRKAEPNMEEDRKLLEKQKAEEEEALKEAAEAREKAREELKK